VRASRSRPLRRDRQIPGLTHLVDRRSYITIHRHPTLRTRASAARRAEGYKRAGLLSCGSVLGPEFAVRQGGMVAGLAVRAVNLLGQCGNQAVFGGDAGRA
jgi:hypothetical protein